MKKIILLLTLVLSIVGLNAQTVGTYRIVSYNGYELQYTVTKLSPAECSVKSANMTSEDAISVVPIPATMEIEGKEFTVTSIPTSGFEYFYSARKFELPNTITTIGARAFYYCNLATEIAIPESVVSIGAKAFYSCAITEAIIPNGVTKIDNGTFELCDNMSKVVIPNSVISIGNEAFKNCKSLTTIELPESIQSISNYTFSECINLSLVICHAPTPPTGNKMFYHNSEDLIIRVPAESLELYRTTEPWSNYDIRKIGSENIIENTISLNVYPNPAKDNLFIETEETFAEISVYDVYGRQYDNLLTRQQGNVTSINVSDLNNGIYFVRVKTENSETVKRFIKE